VCGRSGPQLYSFVAAFFRISQGYPVLIFQISKEAKRLSCGVCGGGGGG
jgi:hypothetical protein